MLRGPRARRVVSAVVLTVGMAVTSGTVLTRPALAAPVGVPVAGVQGTVVAWGYDADGQASVPPGLTDVTAVAASGAGSLVLHADGTVTQFGRQDAAVPVGLHDVTAIAAGAFVNLALRADGTVVAWGRRADVLTLPPGLTDVTAIAAGGNHALALRRDGTVVSWGREAMSPYGEDLSAPIGLADVTAIASGSLLGHALKRDGTVVSWPYDDTPAGLTGVTRLSSGWSHALALRGDGSIVTWGQQPADVPAGLTGVTALAAGAGASYALRADGTVTAWGRFWNGPATVPPGLTGVTALAVGDGHVLALVETPSTDATLSGLSLSVGTLSPAFDAGTTSYTAQVGNDVTSITLTPRTAHVLASVTVDGVAVDAGQTSGQVALPVGRTDVTTVVTARDGTTRTYTVAVTRAGLAPTFTDGTIGALRVGTSLVDGVAATGSPAIGYAVTAGALPAGLTLDPATGAVTGTPTSAGPYDTTITATNAHGTATVRLTGSVASATAPAVVVTQQPGSGAATTGAQFGFAATELAPGSTVTVTLHSDPVVLHRGTVGTDGRSDVTVALPGGVPAGAHRVEFVATAPDGTVSTSAVWFAALADGTVGEVSLDGPVAPPGTPTTGAPVTDTPVTDTPGAPVTRPAPGTAPADAVSPAPAAQPATGLAQTGPGVDLLPLAGLAIAAVALGAALTLVRRRRTR